MADSNKKIKLNHEAPKLDERIGVGVLGGTGLVGRALAARLLSHPTMKLAMVVGSPATAAKPFKEVWEKKEASLRTHYGDIWSPQEFPDGLAGVIVQSFDDLLKSGPNGTGACKMVVSAIAASHGWMEEELLKEGFDVFSISPYARFDPRAHLVVPEVNGSYLMLGAQKDKQGRLFKSPNCVSCGLSLVLEAVKRRFGLQEVAVTTFQTLTGRGDLKYDLDLVKGNVYPLRDTIEETDNYIRKEIKAIVGEDFKISVTAQRIYAQRGHYVDVRIKTKTPVEDDEAAVEALASFNPFRGTTYDSLPSVPTNPISVDRTAGFPRPVQAIKQGLDGESAGMSVTVGHLNTKDEMFDLTLSFVVDNIVRGAYGAALINAECFYRAMENPTAGPGSTDSKSAPLITHDAAVVAIASAYASASEFMRKFIQPADQEASVGDDTEYTMLHC